MVGLWRPADLRAFREECPQATPGQCYLYIQAFQAWIINDFEQAVSIYEALLYNYPDSEILRDNLAHAQEAQNGIW